MVQMAALTSTTSENSSTRMNDSSPQRRTPSEEIAGRVERVTFFNEENGYAALQVKALGSRCTAAQRRSTWF